MIEREYEDINNDEAVFRTANEGLQAERFLAEAKKQKLDVDEDTRSEMEARISAGNAAAWEVAKANLGLAASLVKRYVKSPLLRENHFISNNDIYQEAAHGIFRAAKSFEPGKSRFSTFAMIYAEGRIKRYIQQNHFGTHISIHDYLAMRRVDLYHHWLSESMAEVDRATLEFETGLSSHELERLEKIRAMSTRVLSLEELTDPGSTSEDTVHLIGTHTSAFESDLPDVEETALVDVFRENVIRMIQRSELPKRSAEMVMLRHGLTDNHERTLEEIGNEYDLTKERVRQILIQAHAILRSLQRPMDFV